jgi:hypothetical protein
MDSSYSINSDKSFDILDFISILWNKKSKINTIDHYIEIDTMGIHPKYIEIVDEDPFLVIKGVNINNLNERLFKVLKKTEYSYIDLENIGYRAGKISIGVKK